MGIGKSKRALQLVLLLVEFIVVVAVVAQVQLVSTITVVQAFWPDAPYVDQCTGRSQDGTRCPGVNQIQNSHPCRFFRDSTPFCFDEKFVEQKPPYEKHEQSDFVNQFFTFSFGVHLSEGNDQQFYYNIDRSECAKLCVQSANAQFFDDRGDIQFIRCLSFDYYPFENPRTESPYNEAFSRGVCVLNSANRDSGRLRNEDQGFSDAELFYRSHFTRRPFSDEDGYYEIRDARGGEVAQLLDYGGSEDFAPSIVWGQSRWGISHLTVPQPLDQEYKCVNGEVEYAEDPPSDEPSFTGGYTPVNEKQHCPGHMTKPEAEKLCEATGGYLCASQTALETLNGRKLGCSLDNQVEQNNVWHTESIDDGSKKFVRCCAEYGVVNNCDQYRKENIEFCSTLKGVSACVEDGSGTSRQKQFGFGNLLGKFRRDCREEGYCNGLTKGGAWSARDRCIWCINSDGSGVCRPGNDFGICSNAKQETKSLFALKMKGVCSADEICSLSQSFPDLGFVLGVPTQSPTISPTLSPIAETQSPSPAPTNAWNCANAWRRNKRKHIARKRCNNHSNSCTWFPEKSSCIPNDSPLLLPSVSPTPAPTGPWDCANAWRRNKRKHIARKRCNNHSYSCTWFPENSSCIPNDSPLLLPSVSPTPAPTGTWDCSLAHKRSSQKHIAKKRCNWHSYSCTWFAETSTCIPNDSPLLLPTLSPTPAPTNDIHCPDLHNGVGTRMARRRCRKNSLCFWNGNRNLCMNKG